MTVYEKARVKLRTEMDDKIATLDGNRAVIGEAQYWKQFSEINSFYSDKVAEIDEAERSYRSLQQAKETGSYHDRPEQRYADVMGQLKAQKITELLDKLTRCSSSNKVSELRPDDPFYMEKSDPIGTFERWWSEELQSLPSYDEIQSFLRRVDIDKHGMIYIDLEDKCKPLSQTSSSNPHINLGSVTSEYLEILKSDILKTSRQRAKERRSFLEQKQKRRSPLLANTDHFKNQQKQIQQRKKFQAAVDTLSSVVFAYELDLDLESKLVDHIISVCVPMGMTREDQYKPMLEQFLRYVTTPEKRIHVVVEAINKRWKVLSDGTI